ncbi:MULTISPECIES: SDR family NAD(P)-dependent oxidoreductase [unclassified Mycobacterium]|uniref:SDR family NAD(P)-dependent oxidoreductase n=1 Tax=unclassified Mycobacterium TaxID=2642494 RepID=UPI00274155CC|nr:MULTISPECIES: SDR family NAD(P)-dependent oxidoreductase [unclassified Mycobacterium]MDP7701223.1 SDR family NAD(P)-dependent oxidoreductase [Mycobacterium sp. TY815]MDP7724088.1 SDR family NAD(P)-dependent oxidoreductase [Mycobacterium sp. TY814]
MSGRVAVVTGASRGAGHGIAAALAARGWRVYATGRSISDAPPGGVAARVDHADDDAVGRLFERVRSEEGRLDLLVNNAAVVSDELVSPKPFWEKPRALADVLDVGLRSSYVASWYAAPLLVAGGRGLVAFTSSPGSVCYMHGPAYGAQKAGVDKMAADMAVDFRGTGVATVSIWMGILLTEKLRAAFAGKPEALTKTAEHAETPEFTGYLLDAVFDDPELAALSGQTFIGAELAERYGIVDEGGRRPPSHRHLGAPREPSAVVIR